MEAFLTALPLLASHPTGVDRSDRCYASPSTLNESLHASAGEWLLLSRGDCKLLLRVWQDAGVPSSALCLSGPSRLSLGLSSGQQLQASPVPPQRLKPVQLCRVQQRVADGASLSSLARSLLSRRSPLLSTYLHNALRSKCVFPGNELPICVAGSTVRLVVTALYPASSPPLALHNLVTDETTFDIQLDLAPPIIFPSSELVSSSSSSSSMSIPASSSSSSSLIPIPIPSGSGLSCHAVNFSRIGGHEIALKTIQQTLRAALFDHQRYLDFGLSPPRGVLLYGPTGTGKTLVTRALPAENPGVRFLAVS
ncbi:MAG: hypothetical protein Q8P67_02765, partial [archaeon]|nr:hypothetical protein [archaeon]